MDWTVAGTVLAVVLTVMVYSYLIGDNVIFRLAEHILVGVSVGFATVTVIFNVLIPAYNNVEARAGQGSPLVTGLYVIPIIAGVVLLFRPFRASRPVTNLVVAFVVGTVAALALGGALAGTFIPQIAATMLPLTQGNNGGSADVFGIIGNVVLVIATVLTLWYFQFTMRKNQGSNATARRGPGLTQTTRLLGRWTLMLALGAVFASVFLTYLAALIDRLSFLLKLGG